jgi:pimeloyl-ACP methyl ester carboxylesterase
MGINILSYKRSKNTPVVIFIHGLGMDRHIWANPSKSRIVGGAFPITKILCKKPSVRDLGLSKDMLKEDFPRFSVGERPISMKTLFQDLRAKDISVITWSQKRPAGPIDAVVSELAEVVNFARRMTKAGIILVGHSRGGLIGRKYLLKRDKSIRGLITISAPHKGSSIAKVTRYITPLITVINPLVPEKEKGTVSFAIKKVFEFLRSGVLKELLPESNFLESIKDGPLDWVKYVSVGGTKPTLFTFYRWSYEAKKDGEYQRWFLRPRELFSIPDILEKVIPENLYPEELKKGKGDGLVSLDSSRIPWASEHYGFNLNHAEILFDKNVRNTLIKSIEDIL